MIDATEFILECKTIGTDGAKIASKGPNEETTMSLWKYCDVAGGL